MRGVRNGTPRYEYMLVTADEYELPTYTADSPSKLARMVGDKQGQHISRAICYGYRYRVGHHWYKAIKIEIGDDDDEYIGDT